MDYIQAILLALIQGLTEFLPVSSSAHLILPAQLLGWHDQGLAFDVAVHTGTLIAVIVYYRASLQSLLFATLGRGDALVERPWRSPGGGGCRKQARRRGDRPGEPIPTPPARPGLAVRAGRRIGGAGQPARFPDCNTSFFPTSDFCLFKDLNASKNND